MMDTLPWYRSKVFVGLLISLITGVAALVGKQDVVKVDTLTPVIETVLEIVSFCAAAYSAWHRARSPLQPLTLIKPKEEQQ